MPWEVRAKEGHRLLSQVYFLHTFALSGRKYAKNILDLKVDGTLSLYLGMACTKTPFSGTSEHRDGSLLSNQSNTSAHNSESYDSLFDIPANYLKENIKNPDEISTLTSGYEKSRHNTPESGFLSTDNISVLNNYDETEPVAGKESLPSFQHPHSHPDSPLDVTQFSSSLLDDGYQPSPRHRHAIQHSPRYSHAAIMDSIRSHHNAQSPSAHSVTALHRETISPSAKKSFVNYPTTTLDSSRSRLSGDGEDNPSHSFSGDGEESSDDEVVLQFNRRQKPDTKLISSLNSSAQDDFDKDPNNQSFTSDASRPSSAEARDVVADEIAFNSALPTVGNNGVGRRTKRPSYGFSKFLVDVEADDVKINGTGKRESIGLSKFLLESQAEDNKVNGNVKRESFGFSKLLPESEAKVNGVGKRESFGFSQLLGGFVESDLVALEEEDFTSGRNDGFSPLKGGIQLQGKSPWRNEDCKTRTEAAGQSQGKYLGFDDFISPEVDVTVSPTAPDSDPESSSVQARLAQLRAEMTMIQDLSIEDDDL